jgi:myo-inositol-1-phosphate synthase
MWTANTERFCVITPGIHDTADNLVNAINKSEKEISPSTVYAVASILEGCSFINGSP